MTIAEIIAENWATITADAVNEKTPAMRRERAIAAAYAVCGAHTQDDYDDVADAMSDAFLEDDAASGPYEFDTNAGGAFWHEEQDLVPDWD